MTAKIITIDGQPEELTAYEIYLENLLAVIHAACIDPDAHVGLRDEVWQSLSDITGIENPFYVNVPKKTPREEIY